jgi:chromate transporter
MTNSQKTAASAGIGRSPGLLAIFLAFLRLGCTSFGGGTAGWLHRDIVLRRRWLDDPTFLAMLTVGQALPGSNGTKLTVLIGQHLRGTAGATVALFALLAGPFVIVLAIAAVYAGLTGQKIVHDMLDGVAAAVVGLTFATGLRSVVHGAPEPIAWAIAALTGLCVGVLRWPLIPGRPMPRAAQHRAGLGAADAALTCATSATASSRSASFSRPCHCCRSAAAMR